MWRKALHWGVRISDVLELLGHWASFEEILAGRTDVSDLAVSVNSLTPVSEPRYAVASMLVGRWARTCFRHWKCVRGMVRVAAHAPGDGVADERSHGWRSEVSNERMKAWKAILFGTRFAQERLGNPGRLKRVARRSAGRYRAQHGWTGEARDP